MAAELTFGVTPCIKCGHMTRSGKTKAADAPGTRERVSGGLCAWCGPPRKRPGTPDRARRDADNLAGLEAYMRARAARIARNQRLVSL